MQRALHLTLCVFLAAVACGFAPAEETDAYAERGKEIQEALEKVKAVLPEGWEAKIDVESRFLSLEVTRKEKAYVIDLMPNGPPNTDTGDPEKEKEKYMRTISLSFELRPYLTPDQYTEAFKKNRVNDERRANAHRELAESGIAFPQNDKPGRPGPWTFRPKNDDERERVRRYAILFSETEPAPLPTHYHKKVAFRYYGKHYSIGIQDPAIDKEVAAVEEKVQAALSAYEPPKDAEKKP